MSDDAAESEGGRRLDREGRLNAYTANYLGTAQGAFNNVVKYLQSKPDLLEDDTVCMMVYEMDSALQAARTSLWYACWLWEQKDYAAAELAALRVNSSAKQAALMVTNKAFEVCGARSAFRDMPFERAWRDARMFSLHTRESKNARLHAKAIVTGDFHAKREYSKSAERRRWEDYGVTPPASHQ
ncbi:MAG: hypothetical protein IPM06_07455 [Rhizobiales bacterium]|nr:hypothetical protein [Hyphomicrobiales bacterium]